MRVPTHHRTDALTISLALKSLSRNLLCCFSSTVVLTTNEGDIPLMWMRDSAAQVNQYIPLAANSPERQVINEGTIRRQIKWIGLDPYGSSFRLFLDFDHKVRNERE
jgi:meiotically up-regulated gene 157 (Mug157) protein